MKRLLFSLMFLVLSWEPLFSQAKDTTYFEPTFHVLATQISLKDGSVSSLDAGGIALTYKRSDAFNISLALLTSFPAHDRTKWSGLLLASFLNDLFNIGPGYNFTLKETFLALTIGVKI